MEFSESNRTNLTMNLKMAFTIENSTIGLVVDNYDKYLTIDLIYTNFTYTDGGNNYTVQIDNIPIHKCTHNDFSESNNIE